MVHPNGITDGIARKICEESKRKLEKTDSSCIDDFQENLDKELDAIKERLYQIAEAKQARLFRLNRNLIERGVNCHSELLSQIRDEAFKTTKHPEMLLDPYNWKYAR